MKETILSGPMSMIKIDGSTIKHLREKQGLTQLYLATAVQVTTDTISRWENRRYPSIKRENGIKLAEALNVALEEILENESEEKLDDTTKESSTLKTENNPVQKKYGLKKTWPVILLGVIFAAVAGTFLYFSYVPPTSHFSAERIVPAHCTPGQPFPVIIKVTGAVNSSTALIIRESLPDNSTLLKISPRVNSTRSKDNTIKWLKKINTTAVFTYIISIDGKEGDIVHFHGTAAIGSETGPPASIEGDNSTILSKYHWADSDKDNIISDNEILAVYDRYSEIDDIDPYIDTIEEIWLGSGYKWNSSTSSFTIFD